MRYTAKELEAMPTLAVGQADDLKVDTGDARVWLSRMGVADDASYANQVTVEMLTSDGEWRTVRKYQG